MSAHKKSHKNYNESTTQYARKLLVKLIKNVTELIGIKDSNMTISFVFEKNTHIEIQEKLDYPASRSDILEDMHCHHESV